MNQKITKVDLRSKKEMQKSFISFPSWILEMKIYQHRICPKGNFTKKVSFCGLYDQFLWDNKYYNQLKPKKSALYDHIKFRHMNGPSYFIPKTIHDFMYFRTKPRI